MLAALLVAGVAPADLRADTTLDSGTTTLSTGTDYGQTLYVGKTDAATLIVNAGGHATDRDSILGDNLNGVGTVTVTSGGRWTNSGYIYVGNHGRGTLNVTGGSVTNTDGYIAVAGGNHSIGTATVSGGTWANSGDLTVGDNGYGTLNVTGGSVTNWFGYIARNTGVGTATVSSGTWANSGDLTVGYKADGTLNVTGGSVTSASGILGDIQFSANDGEGFCSFGTATVSSGTWANSGGLTVGNHGTGTLNVSGGTVTNVAIGYIGRYADGGGTATVSSGTWANGNLAVGNSGTGTLNVSGGSVTNANGYIGRFAGSHGTATVSSGTWVSSGNLTVGDEGTGRLTMSGGLVTVGGTLLRGAGGTIHLNSGGTLQIGTGTTGGVLGNNLTNNGTLIFNRSDAYTYSGIISGTGSVTKQGDGTLTLGEANSYSGGTTIRAGTVSLVGGGSINHGSAYLIVGESNGDSGALSVTGGSVTNTDGYIGFNTAGVGTATVSSGTWANSGFLVVGYDGTGTLNVNGGRVTSRDGSLGFYTGSVGTATVSSGTWANSGSLLVGTVGTGTLTMSGGLVTVGDTLSRGTGSTINLNSGGTLQIGVGGASGVLGVDALTNNGTLVFNRSDASTYSGVLSGSGAVTKQGGGTLTLGAANSYSGLTTISAGTLALSGIGSIGKGGLGLGTTGSPGVFDLSGLTAGSYSLPATGNLAGVGTLSGSGKSLAVLGSFTPGNSPGTVTLGSGFTLDLSSSGTSVFEITDPAYTAGTYDLVNGDGSVVFGGILNLAFSGGSYADGTDVLQLFANNGGRSGNFSAVNATGLAAGQSATFNPATGFITVVPEPSTCASLLAGLAYGGSVMFRRRRAR